MPTRAKKIDLYIATEVISPFFGGIVFFTFIFLMFQALRLADFFIVHGVPGSLVLKMAFLLGLSFLPTALPIAFLIAMLVSFGRLSSDSELVAMKSSGIGLNRMAMPALGIGGIVVILSLFLNLEWVPWGLRDYRSTVIRLGNTQVVSSLNEGTFTSGFFDLLIFTDKVDTKTNQLKHVFIYDEREPKNPMTVVAKTGELIPVKTGSMLSSAALMKLYAGNIHRSEPETETYQKIDFGEYNLYLKIDEGEDNTGRHKPRMLSFTSLKEKIATTEHGSDDNNQYRTEFWRRISLAFSALFFVFLGIGFGTVRTRSVRSGAALVTFLVMTVYWGSLVLGTNLAHKGFLHPFIAMQIPNLVIGIAGFFSFKKAAW